MFNFSFFSKPSKVSAPFTSRKDELSFLAKLQAIHALKLDLFQTGGRKVPAGMATVSWNVPSIEDLVFQTRRLMDLGAPWIRHGVLRSDHLLGTPDLLQKIADNPESGPIYRPVLFAATDTLSDGDMLELTGYALVLRAIQGVFPEQGIAWFPDGTQQSIDLPGYFPATWPLSSRIVPLIVTA